MKKLIAILLIAAMVVSAIPAGALTPPRCKDCQDYYYARGLCELDGSCKSIECSVCSEVGCFDCVRCIGCTGIRCICILLCRLCGFAHLQQHTNHVPAPCPTVTTAPEPVIPTIMDALEVLKQLAGLENTAPKDSTINDALEILKFLAGLPISRFNTNGGLS